MSYNTQFHKKVTESPFKSCNHNLIDKLSTNAREMICTENAERIWNFG